jgi:hypothetical protein
MRLFGLFKGKDQGTGLSELKKMHELLDLPGLLASLSRVDKKLLPSALDLIWDICANQPHILRMHIGSISGPVMQAPFGDDPASQDRWLNLVIKLVELGFLEKMMDQGLPNSISYLLARGPDPDWRTAYLVMEVARSKNHATIASDEHLSRLVRTMEIGDPRARQYAAATLDRIMGLYGADPFIRLGGPERFRGSLLDPDQYVADIARSILARCEVVTTAHDRMGSMPVEGSTILVSGEGAASTQGKKEEEGKESRGGYYRPGSKPVTRSKGPVKKANDDVVEDMNLRKRKVDSRFEKEKNAVLSNEAQNVYTGHDEKDDRDKDDKDNEEFEIEEE